MLRVRRLHVHVPAVLARTALSLVLGSVVTVAVAWSCAMWSAQRTPDPNPAPHHLDWHALPYEQALAYLASNGSSERDGPDGFGLYYRTTAIGYEYLSFSGHVTRRDGRADVWFRGPYGTFRHLHSAGWPWPALRSCVTSLDNDRGTPHPRTRWELPPMEILSRGLCTNDLPAWLHAQPDRRLPLLMAPGFAADALLYALPAYALLCWRDRAHRTAAARCGISAPSPCGRGSG